MILNDPNLPTLKNFVYDTNIKTLITETRFISFFFIMSNYEGIYLCKMMNGSLCFFFCLG